MASTDEVQEVVSESIINVKFRKAQITNKVTYELGKKMLQNDTTIEDTCTVEIPYEDKKTYTFSRGSPPVVVSATITTGLPFIIDGGNINVISNISNEPFQWGSPDTKTEQDKGSIKVTVPPKSKVVVKYLATQGTCSIPYSYTQEDKMSNGKAVITSHDDGTYNGVSFYDFKFQIDQAQSL